MQHSFDIEIAQKFGVNVAIFLNNMAFWIKKNIANRKNFNDDRYWTYNSIEAYAELFPYWTAKQMRTVISNCISLGLVIKGNYNNVQYDRTSWYALTNESHKLLNIPILPNGQMEVTERANGFDRKGGPIPDALPDSKTDKKSFYKNSNQKKHDFSEKMAVRQNEPKSTIKEFDEMHPTYDINAKDWQERLKKKRALIKEMNMDCAVDQYSLAYLIKLKSNKKLPTEKSHGRDTIKQGRNETTGRARQQGVRKVESYLPQ
jgi:hypothetical protein